MYLPSNIRLKSKTAACISPLKYTVLKDKSCYHCHTVEINEMSLFLSSNSCAAAVDPPAPLDEAIFIT
jgi:hypothetical protein